MTKDYSSCAPFCPVSFIRRRLTTLTYEPSAPQGLTLDYRFAILLKVMNTLLAAAAIATIAGTLIGLLSYRFLKKSYKYTKLTYEIWQPDPLIIVERLIRNRIEIKYFAEEGTEVIEELWASVVTIRNVGTEAVEYTRSGQVPEEDPQTPVTIDFGERVRVLGNPRVDTSPKNPKVYARKHSEDQSKVVLHKFLLNPGQEATILTLLTNFPSVKPSIYAHLRGVPDLEEHSGYKPSTGDRLDKLAESMSRVEFGGIFATAIVFVLMVLYAIDSLPDWESGTWVLVVSLIVLLATNVFNLVRRFGESRALSVLYLVLLFLMTFLVMFVLVVLANVAS